MDLTPDTRWEGCGERPASLLALLLCLALVANVVLAVEGMT